MEQTILYMSDGSVYTAPMTPVGTWYWVKPDYALPPSHPLYPLRECATKLGSCPCVFPLDYPYAVPITQEWQYYIARLMAMSIYNKVWTPKGVAGDLTSDERKQIENCYTGTFSSGVFINGTAGYGGGDVLSNFVTNENLDAPPPRFEKIRLFGTISLQGREVVDSQGHPSLEINSFVWEDGPPSEVDLGDPRVMYGTTITTKQFEDGSRAVNKFPRGDGHSVPIPLIRKRAQSLLYPLWYVGKYTGVRRPLYNPPVGTPWL